MNTYVIYKGIKERLSTVAPCFYYIGQYNKGKENTSYKVPALYIEMPKNLNYVFFPGKIKAAREAQFKVHLISHAPYKNHENEIQDSAIAAHQSMINSIETLLTGYILKDAHNRILTQQIHPIAANMHNYTNAYVWSVLTFQTEFYGRGAS